ncbi:MULTISPECIES: response regulator [unclassified Spirosoma]|uniref:response regulator n=1 Tax=unclassified Spirosoma TaxID=2621999 RepID=UPI00095DD401|nr:MULTISPECIES: response regulator [unclassified Spirosoma]MBN8822243.1 response regulator [Spirosoma sp.]OJW72444.1 MAG: response regulator [Spirosoma sp. 48-14]
MAFHLSASYIPVNPPSVWVVDDDEDDRLFIRSAFEDLKTPVSVLMLTDGDQVLPRLTVADTIPQLILLDINMTRQNGFETLTQLRSTPTYAELPVVMLTTSSDKSDRQRSMDLGANQCLTKPASYNELVTMVTSLSERWALA